MIYLYIIRVRDLMPERDISSLRMWVSWGWAAWKNCSRRVVVVALGSTKEHIQILMLKECG